MVDALNQFVQLAETLPEDAAATLSKSFLTRVVEQLDRSNAQHQILTAEQVGELLGGISAKSVTAKARSGELRGSKPGQRWLFQRCDVMRYLERHANDQRREAGPRSLPEPPRRKRGEPADWREVLEDAA